MNATWQITIISAGSEQKTPGNPPEILFHCNPEDLKEVQALATEARHRSSSVQIWITTPSGEKYPWD